MKLLAGAAFTTKMTFGGVLPTVPVVPSVDKSRLDRYLREIAWQEDMFPVGLSPKPEKDTYWVGKSMGKVSAALQLADAIGADKDRDHMLQALKNELEDWFDGQAPKLFYYDKTWATMVGAPASYDADAALNDHHFHYGYFVQAGAAIARYDQDWAKRWGNFIELLAKDAANVNRDEHRFPFLRYMDPYAGHGWANGPSQYHDGNNEESSSEDMNFSCGAPPPARRSCATPASSCSRTRSRPSSSTGSTPTRPSSPRASTTPAWPWCGARAASSTRGGTRTPSSSTASTTCPSPAARCTWDAGPSWSSGSTTRS
jgi:hypothetical protein